MAGAAGAIAIGAGIVIVEGAGFAGTGAGFAGTGAGFAGTGAGFAGTGAGGRGSPGAGKGSGWPGLFWAIRIVPAARVNTGISVLVGFILSSLMILFLFLSVFAIYRPVIRLI